MSLRLIVLFRFKIGLQWFNNPYSRESSQAAPHRQTLIRSLTKFCQWSIYFRQFRDVLVVLRAHSDSPSPPFSQNPRIQGPRWLWFLFSPLTLTCLNGPIQLIMHFVSNLAGSKVWGGGGVELLNLAVARLSEDAPGWEISWMSPFPSLSHYNHSTHCDLSPMMGSIPYYPLPFFPNCFIWAQCLSTGG